MEKYAMEQLATDIATIGNILVNDVKLSDDYRDWLMDRFEDYGPSEIEEIDAIDFVNELKSFRKNLEDYSFPAYVFSFKRVLQIMDLDFEDWKSVYEKPEFDCSKNKFAFTEGEEFKHIMNNFEKIFGFPFNS